MMATHTDYEKGILPCGTTRDGQPAGMNDQAASWVAAIRIIDAAINKRQVKEQKQQEQEAAMADATRLRGTGPNNGR